MSGSLKATVLILGLLLATAAVVGLALAWTGRTSEPSEQASLGTPANSQRLTATPADAGLDTDASTKTATFALG